MSDPSSRTADQHTAEPRDPAGRTADGSNSPLVRAWLRARCLEAGADDVGFVPIGHRELDVDREDLREAAPWTRTLISIVVRMHRENIRSRARSLANIEFHACDDRVTHVSRSIVALLEQHGVRAMHTAFGFPMEADRWPGKLWIVSHKLVAQAAGLGKIGIHRNLIHPRYGSFVFLGTVLIDRDLDAYDAPLDRNPCLTCKLCVAACPTGAIKPDGAFDFSACYTHNYREFMGGFGDWVEQIAASPNAHAYRRRVSDRETVSMWQSLAFRPNYKAAYCLAVCPAGEDVISPYLRDKAGFQQEVLRPLVARKEPVYVVPGSDAEAYVTRRFPHKSLRRVGNGLRPRTIEQFITSLPWVFQRGQADGLEARYHFVFTGREPAEVTIVIRNQRLEVQRGQLGTADLRVVADSDTWLGFLAGERHLVWALITRRIRLKGSPRLLLAFGRCFPR